MSFFRGRDATTQATKEKVIFYKGSVFFRTEEEEMLIVTNEDVHGGTSKYLQKSSRNTKRTAYSTIGKAPRL